MAKTVFHQSEIKPKDGEVMLGLIKTYAVEDTEVIDEVPEYNGPTADDLRREAEAFKMHWESEKQRMLNEARAEADEIVAKAKDGAFAEVKRQTDQAQIIKTDAQNNAAEIIKDAQDEAQKIVARANAEQESVRSQAQKDGYDKGYNEGYDVGKAEADRLVERIHTILSAVMKRREEILNETEQQIIELVILTVRKVVKVLSDNQISVIMNNVLMALKKVKGRGDVILRVNMDDAKLAVKHTKDFTDRVESIKNITVVEDSSVEKGGCIVETDFGAVDARISSQLKELEAKILEVSPIKTVDRSTVMNPDA